ncbi:50S ribosomal protein L25/general stress protein Ctc [Bacillus sp. FJAT-47783]|uniref:50S ribosomal protein L25/general stress protein Ctc n=1 Tax=Bacillus sp. FJAT-47783 TaxID=2922712 RepID=UPI001FAC6E6F|nr:50S ribosomal protein L25/general stress protein Ctc [Bacillus sp. FJAT-47783]
MSAQLRAEERSIFSNSARREIREQGHIPAVIYGKSVESTSISLDGIEFIKTLKQHGRNAIINISLGDQKHAVMVNEIQQDPLKGVILHADLHVVNMNEEVDVDVQIQLIGEAQGVKDGGVLQQPLHQVKLRAKPGEIPTTIEVDVTNLGVNEVLHVKDIPLNSQMEILDDEEEVVVSILPPKQEEEINPGEEQESGEPESVEGRETNE